MAWEGIGNHWLPRRRREPGCYALISVVSSWRPNLCSCQRSVGQNRHDQAGIANNLSAIPEHLARSAMQQDQKRIGGVLSPDHRPLIDPAQMQIADLGDTSKQDLTRVCPNGGVFTLCLCSNNRMITNLLGAATGDAPDESETASRAPRATQPYCNR
jgi:hypothetical protein